MIAAPRCRALSRRARLALRAALLFLAAWPPAAWLAARALIVAGDAGGRADAIVVLGGSASYMERTRFAAELYRSGCAPKILLTDDGGRGGWSSREQRNPAFVELAAEELGRRGVPAEAVERLPGVVTSTYDEAVSLRGYVESRGLRSILVVTSAYHTRRARWTFSKVFAGGGVSVRLAGVQPGEQTPPPALWWLSARGWQAVAGEYVKMVCYGLRYF